jgi:hypothetical protein
MLRLLVLALLLLNSAYFAWSQGYLAGLGFAPSQQSEPQRMTQQIKPQTVQLLTAQDMREIDAVPEGGIKPTQCLQAGPFDEVQSALLSSTLATTLPSGAWTLEAVLEPARWIVYMGKYPNADLLAKKRAELASLKLKFEPLGNPALQLGLSLGGFETKAAASAHLEALSRRGLRTAKVIQERVEVRGMMLRLPQADDTVRARLDELKPVLADKAVLPCP